MSELFCQPCHLYFKHKSSLERHYTTKRHKKRISDEGRVLQCACGKTYSHYQEDKSNETLREEIKELKALIEVLSKQKSVNHTTKVGTQHIKNQNIIIVNLFGKEHKHSITNEKIMEIINNTVPKIMATVSNQDKNPDPVFLAFDENVSK